MSAQQTSTLGAETVPAAGPTASPVATVATGWVRRARRGDLGAFEHLYRAHVPRIYALALRMTADPSRAEDLTQDAFVRAWDRLASFRAESEIGTWLHRLAVNVILGDLRARHRWPEEAFEEVTGGRAQEPAVAPARTGERIDLERALAALPTGARTVLVLHDIEGYRHGEIAELLGVSEGTSKAQLFRARRLLREALEP